MNIGFVGLGKLGMPCAEAMAEAGHTVLGFDIVPKKSNTVLIQSSLEDAVKDQEIVFVATPTPHIEGYDGKAPTTDLPPKDFDYSAVVSVLKQLDQTMSRDQIIVLISTVLPGTVREHFQPEITRTRFVYNPYLIAMGTVKWDFLNPEMVMIGTRDGAVSPEAKTLSDFYKSICRNDPRIEVGTWDECEAIKIFYNTFISTKLALVNMIQDVAEKNGNIDVDIVTSALARSTHRITGPAYMRAGMGDGGSCHPRDNIALRWLAEKYDLGYDIFQTIMQARERQAHNMARSILKHGSRIQFTSDYYKSGVEITDGSYSLLIQHYVKEMGGSVVSENGDVVVKVHENDHIDVADDVIIFDPWRTHQPAPNVVHYGSRK